MADLDWGSIPTWVGTAFGSVSAMLAAFSYRRSILDKVRGQASQVSVWLITSDDEPLIEFQESEKVALSLPILIRVTNRSDSPVFDIEVKVRQPEPKYRRRGGLNEVMTLEELPPREVAIAKSTLYIFTKGKEGYSVTVNWNIRQPTLTFTDALGRRWCGSPDRRLQRVKGATGGRETERGYQTTYNPDAPAYNPFAPGGSTRGRR